MRCSEDWDEINAFTNSTYAGHALTPLDAGPPRARMATAGLGAMGLSRFRYGTRVRVSDFDPEADRIFVLTTLNGEVRHGGAGEPAVTTAAGESFAVSARSPSYRLEADHRHCQLNLTVPHAAAESACRTWFGCDPAPRLWRTGAKIGGSGTAWHSLLLGADRFLAETTGTGADGLFAIRLEELLTVELLRAWSRGIGLDLCAGRPGIAPGCVRRAEAFMVAHARSAPSLSEVAAAAGVSVRTLAASFRRFRDSTPGAFLREQRLNGIHAALTAGEAVSVARTAAEWGYANFGVFARTYRQRFGCLPSETFRLGKDAAAPPPRRSAVRSPVAAFPEGAVIPAETRQVLPSRSSPAAGSLLECRA